MMKNSKRLALGGVVALALAASPVSAQQAATPAGATLHVAPDATITAPRSAVRGFDAPAPAPRLQLTSPTDVAAVRGLAPGEDLVGDGGRARQPALAADTDTYFATNEYKQKAETIERRGHVGAARQFAGAGEAAAANAVLQGVGALITGN
jgi:hypothetical protein